MQDGILRICEPMAGIRLQGGQLPRHAGEVAGRVPGYVLRVLRSQSSTSQTAYATTSPALFRCGPRGILRSPERLGHWGGAHPCLADPRPSRTILAAL